MPTTERSELDKVRTRLVRWAWAYDHGDGSTTAGWTATKWGARREIAKAAHRDFTRTGPHAPLTVGWPGREVTVSVDLSSKIDTAVVDAVCDKLVGLGRGPA